MPFAVQVQPRTGQWLEEYPTGLRLTEVRPWTAADARRFPQAARAVLSAEWRLVVDGTARVWLIATEKQR